MKKLLGILIVVLLLSVVAVGFYFYPFEDLLNKSSLFNTYVNKTGLTVTVKNGVAEVNVDGENLGKTPVSIPGLSLGSHTVKITKISDDNTFYKPFSTTIMLEKGTEANINLEIGPDGVVSGVVLYYEKVYSTNQNLGFLTFESSVVDTKLFLNGEIQNFQDGSNLLGLSPAEYSVKVSKDGYEELEFPIVIRKGLNLYMKVYMFPKPILIKEITPVDEK